MKGEKVFGTSGKKRKDVNEDNERLEIEDRKCF